MNAKTRTFSSHSAISIRGCSYASIPSSVADTTTNAFLDFAFCLQFDLGDVSGMHRHLMSSLKSVSINLGWQYGI